jgi:HD-GYP domain-containing protein (c-di-GMP phosphodiesterase class II)
MNTNKSYSGFPSLMEECEIEMPLTVEKNSFFFQVIDQSNDGICVELGDHMLFANRSFQMEFHTPKSSHTQTINSLLDIVSPESYSYVQGVLQYLQDGLAESFQYEFKAINNRFQIVNVLASTNSIILSGQKGLLSSLRISGNEIQEKMDEVHNAISSLGKDPNLPLRDDLEFENILERILENVSQIIPHYSSQIMLVEENQKMVKILAVRGCEDYKTNAWLKNITFKIDTTPTLKKMFYHGDPIAIINTENDPDWISTPETAWIKSYASAPIRVRNKVIGFLNLNSPEPGYFNLEVAYKLQAFADQAGLVLHNTKLLRDLRTSHETLKDAYDKTLLGWSKALELRDNETEGHTLRVVDLTTRLAAYLGIKQRDLMYVRFGALLHDIGKIAIPDSILFKEGPLTKEEWKTMRKHPEYATEILSPIPYLYPALEIPLFHHERWNGKGYPRGLSGESIPLAARVFAVVDVWDSLISDRRYRSSWPKEKVMSYIQSQSGIQFDPMVVDAFLKMVS